jgi:hypothetical protein
MGLKIADVRKTLHSYGVRMKGEYGKQRDKALPWRLSFPSAMNQGLPNEIPLDFPHGDRKWILHTVPHYISRCILLLSQTYSTPGHPRTTISHTLRHHLYCSYNSMPPQRSQQSQQPYRVVRGNGTVTYYPSTQSFGNDWVPNNPNSSPSTNASELETPPRAATFPLGRPATEATEIGNGWGSVGSESPQGQRVAPGSPYGSNVPQVPNFSPPPLTPEQMQYLRERSLQSPEPGQGRQVVTHPSVSRPSQGQTVTGRSAQMQSPTPPPRSLPASVQPQTPVQSGLTADEISRYNDPGTSREERLQLAARGRTRVSAWQRRVGSQR